MHALRADQYAHAAGGAEARDAKRFFYASSACVYNGDKQKTFEAPSLKEEDAYPALAEDGYGWEKLFSERMCRHFMEDFGLTTRVARFHNVYGPWGTWFGGREKAPAAICRKVIEAKVSGKHEIEIWGSGVQTRSFMFIDDCTDGIQKITNSEILEPINLGSSEAVTINQLVDIAEDIAGIKLKRNYDLSAPKGVNGRNSDNTLIQKYLHWEPNTPLRVGLEKTYRWIYDQYMARERGEAGVVREAGIVSIDGRLLRKSKAFNTEGTENTEQSKRENPRVRSLVIPAFEFLCGPLCSSVSSVLSLWLCSGQRYFAGCSMSFCMRQFSNSPT